MASEDLDDAWQHLLSTSRELLGAFGDLVRASGEHVLKRDTSSVRSTVGIVLPSFSDLHSLVQSSLVNLSADGTESLTSAMLHVRRRIDSPLQLVSRTRGAFALVASNPNQYGTVTPVQALRFVDSMIDHLAGYGPGQNLRSEPSALATFSETSKGLRIELQMSIAGAMVHGFSSISHDTQS